MNRHFDKQHLIGKCRTTFPNDHHSLDRKLKTALVIDGQVLTSEVPECRCGTGVLSRDTFR